MKYADRLRAKLLQAELRHLEKMERNARTEEQKMVYHALVIEFGAEVRKAERRVST